MDENLGVEEYQAVLAFHQWFWRNWQPQLQQDFQLLHLPARFQLSPRLEWLAQDMASLGVKPLALPLPGVTPAKNPSQALGRIYVAEGSTLGGWHIARTAEQRLGFDRDRGARFFFGHGDQTYPRWASLWQLVGERLQDYDLDETCLAAQAMFDELLKALQSGPQSGFPIFSPARDE
jgi:heme oxygenase